MRLTIIEPSDSCREMRSSIEAMLAAMQLEAPVVSCPASRPGLAQAIASALTEAELVLVIGGMSHGGFTYEAAADALERPLVRSGATARYMEQRCRERDLVFSEFERCCHLPQGAKSFPGDGLFPACLCLHGEHALLLFDEYDDPAQLFRLKTLMISLFGPEEVEPQADAVVEEQPRDTAEASAAKPRGKLSKAKKLPCTVRGKSRNRQAMVGCIAIGCVLAVMALIGAATALLGTPAQGIPAQQTNVSSPSLQAAVQGPFQESPPWRLEASSMDEGASSPQPDTLSSEPDTSSSQPDTSSSEPDTSSPQPDTSSSESAVSSSQADTASSESSAASFAETTSSSAESSAAPASSASEVSSSVPEASSEPEVTSSSSEDESVYIYEGESNDEDDEPSHSLGDTPSAHEDAFDEKLSYTYGGSVRRMNAYDLVREIVQNETHGNLAPEALKAHVVATYTMIKYNNAAGIAPAVILNSNISSAVEDAVDAVLGVAVYYNGHYANTVYHSTSCGYTTSSQAVWGGALPYLVSVKSDYDRKSPYYKSSYTISEEDFAEKVKKVYGIALSGDPEDWITVEHDAPGGYVGTVEIDGETRSQGGTYGAGVITGRSVREKLLSFALRSHCFDVEYNASKERFEFTVYGYGHGVGLSQYGAHFMALDGYNYVEILEHYYTGTDVY